MPTVWLSRCKAGFPQKAWLSLPLMLTHTMASTVHIITARRTRSTIRYVLSRTPPGQSSFRLCVRYNVRLATHL